MKDEILYRGRFLRLGCRDGWEYVENHVAKGVVGILAETLKEQIVLIEQWRKPMQSRVIELPAGLVGDDGVEDSYEAAARRELLEETGYAGGVWSALTTGATSPGLTSEVVTLFHAQGVTQQAAGGGVEGEEIEVHLIPKLEVRAWLEQQSFLGKQIDFRVFAALWWALR
jgi:ADP-ribose pyrophosphatase